jgi:sulfate adenylyltransferase
LHHDDTLDAEHTFDEFDPAALGVIALPFDHPFFRRKCNQPANLETCPHAGRHHLSRSGTRAGEPLSSGRDAPQGIQPLRGGAG